MKRGKDIYGFPLTGENFIHKTGTDELRNLISQSNDIYYKYCYRYISPKAAQRIISKLEEVNKEIEPLAVPREAQDKKEELLAWNNQRIDFLNWYIKGYTPEEKDLHQSQMMVNYQVKEAVAAKRAGLAGERDLREIKEILEDYSPMKGLRLKVIKDLANEIKEELLKKYNF